MVALMVALPFVGSRPKVLGLQPTRFYTRSNLYAVFTASDNPLTFVGCQHFRAADKGLPSQGLPNKGSPTQDLSGQE